MPTGFDFNQLMQDPMFQMGLATLAQPRSWENRGFAGLARGAMQGMGNVQQAQQFQRQQQDAEQLRQMRTASMAQDAAEAERKQALVESRNELVKRLRGTAPQPRPLAFKPQEGDADILKENREINLAADAIAAGASPDAYLARAMQLDEKKATRIERAETKEAERIARKKEQDANREARREIVNQQIEARLALEKLHGATSTQIAQMRLDLQRQSRNEISAQREFSQMARNRDTELKLADDFERESKPYKTVVSVFSPAEQYMGGIEKGTAPATPAGDRALVFAYARTLDPNDRVGVRDVMDINKLGNIPEQWGAALRGLAAGRSLPPRVRSDMFSEMKRRFEEANRTQVNLENEFSERTSRYGLEAKNVSRQLGRRNTIKFSDLPK